MRPVEGRSVSRRGFIVGLAGAAMLLALAIGNPQSSAVHGDGYYTYLWARSIVFDHDLDFGNDYETCPDPWAMASMPHGLAMNQWSPGAALFFAPILAFDVATHHPALDNADPHVANACIGVLAERAVTGSIVAGLLVMWLAFLSARRFAGDGTAALAAAAAVLGGPVVYYATVLLSYGHAASAALAGLAVWTWLRERIRLEGRDTGEPLASPPRAWLAMGAALGLAMLARPQNAILVILPLWHWIDVAISRVRPERAASLTTREALRALGPHVAAGVGFTLAMLLVFSMQLYQWWHATGEVFLVPQGDYYLRLSQAPRVMNLLFSSANGLFTYCPLAYVAVAGLFALALRRRTRAVGVPILVTLVVWTWLNACVADWWGAVGFAARRYDAMTVPFAMGIAAALAELVALARTRPRLAPAAAVGTFLVVGAGMTSTDAMMVATGYRSDIAQPSSELWIRGSGEIERGMWHAIGNPLAWPASIPFALQHGVHPRVWDQASMPELFFHRWLTLETQRDLTTLDLIEAHPLLGIGLDPPIATSHGQYRYPTHRGARVLVPISYPYVGSLRLDIDVIPDGDGPVDVWLALDDEVLGTFHVTREQTQLHVPVTRPHEGIVELRMAQANGSVGLARIELRDRDPHPAIAQSRRNARLRARRIAWRIEHGLAPEGTE